MTRLRSLRGPLRLLPLGSTSDPRPRSDWQRMLPEGERPVVVLSATHDGPAVERWRERFPGTSVVTVSPADPPAWDSANVDPRARPRGPVTQVSATIRQLGALDAIVDLLPPTFLPGEVSNRTQLFRALFGYVGQGGVYLVDREAAADPLGTRHLVRKLEGLRAAGAAGDAAGRRDHELALAMRELYAGPDVVAVSKRVRHYVKLRDRETDYVLPRREPGVRLSCLAELPGEVVASRATVSSYGGSGGAFAQTLEAPELHLRLYEGDIALAGRTLMFAGSTVLPDSFRHPFAPTLRHQWLDSGDPTATRIRKRFRPQRTLDGDFYQLDSTFTGHFGHVMTEVVSRLWGWDLVREQRPDLRAIMFRRRHRPFRPEFELELLHAFGIEEDRVVWVDEPVSVRSVASASPMWNSGRLPYAHPGITSIWQRLTAGLLREAPGIETPERIFVSRSPEYPMRQCRNLRQVEALFTQHGFEIIYPERHSLAEQALVFSRASYVAGLGGSAMFNLMHCRRLRSAVILNHDAYTARNEHLFTSLTGGDVHYFWSSADQAHPPGGWTKAAFKSSWAFDFGQHQERLEALLSPS